MILFFLQMDQHSTAVGPIFYWGGFSLTVSWGVNSKEGHPPLKNVFAIEIDALLMKQLMLLIPSQFCFDWSMVESGTSIV